MHEKARELAGKLGRSKEVLIAAHIDSDGITAASIASTALRRAGIEHDVKFLKSLDAPAMKAIKDLNYELTWFVDLGSGEKGLMGDLNAVITDHHAPSRGEVPKEKRRDLLDFIGHVNAVRDNGGLALNPHDFGLDGAVDISGAGVTYLVAKAMDPKNVDLSRLAIVGAIGDLQDSRNRRLVGTNRTVLADGTAAGVVEALTDVRLFGRESRSLIKFLQYANDPEIPELTDSEEACARFLTGLGINVLVGDRWRTWSELKKEERRLIVSKLVELILRAGRGGRSAERLVGEVYVITGEKGILRDAKEFSTLLNACGRYEKADLGFKVCLGDRGKGLEKAMGLLQGHREHIVSSLKVIEDSGITQKEYVQYFHGGERILDSVVGTMAGIILGSGSVKKGVPIIGFAYSPEGVKVSARTTRELVAKGIDLSEVMRGAAQAVGGVGGGHNIAAGATIPKGKEDEFIAHAEALIKRQLGR